MSTFGAYARYYDLLYKDKDYAGEAEYIHRLLRRYQPQEGTLLELGCGSGIHARHLAAKGWTVEGVDQSDSMLQQAEAGRLSLDETVAARLHFSAGDVRNVRIGRTFDAVVSLFHVVSYQTRNADLSGIFDTAREHLRKGGVFIFDCWYGPAVLTERPTVRVKRLEDADVRLTRIAEPVLDVNANTVDVNYAVFVEDKKTNRVQELHEVHRMRYLFKPEIELICAEAGFKIVDAAEWMTGKSPSADTWGVCFIAQL